MSTVSCTFDHKTLKFMKPSIQHSPWGLLSPVYQNDELLKNSAKASGSSFTYAYVLCTQKLELIFKTCYDSGKSIPKCPSKESM